MNPNPGERRELEDQIEDMIMEHRGEHGDQFERRGARLSRNGFACALFNVIAKPGTKVISCSLRMLGFSERYDRETDGEAYLSASGLPYVPLPSFSGPIVAFPLRAVAVPFQPLERSEVIEDRVSRYVVAMADDDIATVEAVEREAIFDPVLKTAIEDVRNSGLLTLLLGAIGGMERQLAEQDKVEDLVDDEEGGDS